MPRETVRKVPTIFGLKPQKPAKSVEEAQFPLLEASSFGERSPVSTEHVRLIPVDIESFVRRVYLALSGIEVGLRPGWHHDQQQIEEYYQKIRENFKKEVLANMALDYLQSEEALGRAPTLKEFGKDRFAYRGKEATLDADVEKAWIDYETILHNALMLDQTSKESVRDGESHEQSWERAGESEHHATLSDDHDQLSEDRWHEHGASYRGAGAVPNFETQADPRTAANKPWWRRLLGG